MNLNFTILHGIRTKCHNVDGEIRMLQKCYKGVTWYNKDATKVLQRCNMV